MLKVIIIGIPLYIINQLLLEWIFFLWGYCLDAFVMNMIALP